MFKSEIILAWNRYVIKAKKSKYCLKHKVSKMYGGSEPTPHNFFKTLKKVASYHAYHNSIIKNGGHRVRFLVIIA